MATITVLDGDGLPVEIQEPLAPGQATMANSVPVTIASDQSAVPVSGTVSAAQSGAWSVTNISGTVSLPTGAATETGVQDIVTAVTSGTIGVGTAGSPNADVLTVQGAASMTALLTSAGDRTDVIYNTQTALTPKFAAISASSSGDNTIVAAVTSKKIRVLAYNLMGAGAVNARFQTAVAGAYLTGLKYIAAAGGGICAPYNPLGWFETVAGDLLNLELSGAVAVGGELVYVEV